MVWKEGRKRNVESNLHDEKEEEEGGEEEKEAGKLPSMPSYVRGERHPFSAAFMAAGRHLIHLSSQKPSSSNPKT